ncbi:OmpA family protein [Zavarzinia compransoris]|uniref:OmpA-like domain-containing protein n=1 Tax=Zavarzinia compransoris TaxID=1264899 RepID=A0A317E1R3_9PROT|nr:hypothetical protein DKG75_16735 [Zavarzinia compransoris]TDP44797.1 OmpA family protein [Zavarzinia compransoris]
MLALGVVATAGGAALAETTDCGKCKDIPLLSRYPGSFLVGQEQRAFDEVSLPAGPTIETPDFKRVFSKTQDLEGRVDKLFYHGPKGRSGLEVYANYQEALAKAGFETLYSCKGDTDDGCGKNFGYAYNNVNPVPGGSMEAGQGIPDLDKPRYTLARLRRPEGDVYLGIAAGDLKFRDVAGILITVVETKPMDRGLVTVDAAALSKALVADGKIALYGVYFDVDSAVVKPESKDQLDQVAALLKSDPALKLLVTGHTDSTGDFAHNMKLSADRAASVVAALVGTYGIEAARLTSAGLGSTSPVAPNDTEEGRGRNRRVELVRQ